MAHAESAGTASAVGVQAARSLEVDIRTFWKSPLVAKAYQRSPPQITAGAGKSEPIPAGRNGCGGGGCVDGGVDCGVGVGVDVASGAGAAGVSVVVVGPP